MKAHLFLQNKIVYDSDIEKFEKYLFNKEGIFHHGTSNTSRLMTIFFVKIKRKECPEAFFSPGE
jgi:hypothetical protein